MKKRDILEIKVENMEFGGTGTTVVDGIKLSYKGGIAGQKVKMLVKKVRKTKAEGKILSVLEPAEIETAPTCPHYGICGGCSMLSVPYDEQIRIKKNQLIELFNEAGHTEVADLEVLKSPSPYEYKNKMEFTFGDKEKGGELMLGMHAKNSPMSIEYVHSCMIVDEDYRKILVATTEFFRNANLPHYRVLAHEGYLRHLVLRKGKNTGDIQVNIVTTTQFEFDMDTYANMLTKLTLNGEIKGILHTFNDSLSDAVIPEKINLLYGVTDFEDILLDKRFNISPFSFFQTNTHGAEVLYSAVKDMIGDKKDIIFDLYSGTGTIGITVSDKANKIVGIEIIEEAVEAAKENIKKNNIKNCEFIAGDVATEVSKISENPELILLDPPRAGIHPKAMGDIISFNSKEILYISCNPKALMNDLKVLKSAGYEIQEVIGVDMFPNSPHVETIIMLTSCGRETE